MTRQFVEVALPPPVSRELTYGVPTEFADLIHPGSVVLVPVQRRLLTGFVLSSPASLPQSASSPDVAPERIRNISQILDAESPLTPEIVELCCWMADYYLAPVGSALAAALPPGVQLTSGRVIQLRPAPDESTDESSRESSRESNRESIGETASVEEDPGSGRDELETHICDQLAGGPLQLTTLKRRLQKEGHLRHRGTLANKGLEQALQRLRRSSAIDIAPALRDSRIGIKREQQVRIVDCATAREALPGLERRAPRQASCLQLLMENGSTPKRHLVAQGFNYAVMKELDSRGLVESYEAEISRDPLAGLKPEERELESPTADQARVLTTIAAAIDKQTFAPFLLKGVTGSGKTLVYMKAVEQVLEAGRGAIVLVPEIALAWQMVRRFKAHFGPQVAVLHSQLSAGERYDTWRRLRRGEQSLLIGARSAVLAPVLNLGLIVVDEEHDGSYSQDDLDKKQPLSYNARDLAVVRGRRAGALVLLGSATPSLETYTNALSGKYELLELPRRIDDRPLPTVDIVDMRREPFQRQERAIFSRTLRLKIRERLERSEQIVLLQNRRGFAPVAQCTECGESLECKRCMVALTYHRSGGRETLRCHYCDYETPASDTCPGCASPTVRFEGVGTQRVEEALLEQFPGIRVIRMDVDTTGWKGAHDELVESFRRREADVLLGTQMVAKGLDFPAVTLVGVISADTGLHLPDFRATERSFQLLTQVAGRSGRGDELGEVVIQTYVPSAMVLQAAAAQDYDSFAKAELDDRRSAGFPPFRRLLLLRWRGLDENTVSQAALRGVHQLASRTVESLFILGPAPAPLARLRGQYRWQALVQAASVREMKQATRRSLDGVRRIAAEHGVDMTVVVDPQTTM